MRSILILAVDISQLVPSIAKELRGHQRSLNLLLLSDGVDEVFGLILDLFCELSRKAIELVSKLL